MTTTDSGMPVRRLTWLLGVGLLAVAMAGALHVSEGREFVRLAERAEPWWLLVAVALQAATYLAQGAIWRGVARAARTRLAARTAYALSLVKVFMDQALPSAGISGNVMVARALEDRAVPRAAVMSGVVVSVASFQAAYVLCLAAALVILALHGEASALVVLASIVFVVFATALAVAVLALSGRAGGSMTRRVERLPYLRRVVEFVQAADARLVRNPRVLLRAVGLQAGIVLLDAATVWVLLRSLGTPASPSGVFASFMISTLVRTIGFVPGGLGIFEVTSIVTLRMAGVGVAAALAATVMFRGLSFWLPMLPGLWLSRRLPGGSRPEPRGAEFGGYWALSGDELTRRLGSDAGGLSSIEAADRLRRYGPNAIREQEPLSRLRTLGRQLRSPLLMLLVFAAVVSILTGQWLDAGIVLTVVAASAGVGYSREFSAHAEAAALRARVRSRTRVLRDGRATTVPVEEVVPGDVVLLSAGSLVPADAIVLEASDFFVSEAILTGESFPVQKRPGMAPETAALRERTNTVFLGTSARSGAARCLVVETGPATELGSIAHRLSLRPPETAFDRGVRRFGSLLTIAMLVLVFLVFVVHVLQHRPPVETLLFSIALAVGLSPELLPAILTVNLARGARMMAHRGVLVRRLNAIENLGSMDVLCTDKTGTLTEGVVQVEGAYDADGASSDEVLELAARNAALETGVSSPLDEAILRARTPDLSGVQKLAEIPFDPVRRRASVVVRGEDGSRLITKGAFQAVLEACTRLSGGAPLDAAARAGLDDRFREWSEHGVRVLAVAEREIQEKPAFDRADERDLAFVGFLAFLDRPKDDAPQAIRDLAAKGVAIKLITGDNRLVAQHVAGLVGMRTDRLLTGAELDRLQGAALWRAAAQTDLFAEVDPTQKERIILALKEAGHVVGFLGDGVNDAPAMHAADTSLSVEGAVDVAREACDFVLLERDLDVIRGGIEEGRRTFANTLKYVLTTTSANLGNMISMALASVFLPFLPLLAGQILLNNFLSDIPAVGLAGDSVDTELIERPRRWDIAMIGRFMVEFGVLSSAFDFLTFGVLLFGFRAAATTFRTGWFVESLLTELVIALVVRTRRPFFRSRPGSVLLISTMALIPLALALPYVPFVAVLGFVPLPGVLLVTLCGITGLYVVAAELAKRRFQWKEG